MINEYSRLFLIDAVSKYRNAEHEMWDIYCARTRHAHDDAAAYLCAAVEAFLENDDENFRDILNRAAWNGEETPLDEGLVEQLKERAKQIDKEHEPKLITVEELTERLKPVEKEYKPMTEEDIKGFKEFMAQIEADKKK